ncbi:MAG: TRAP transporter small permease [Planctomycetota bacterium]|nr:TRAP transporter small permease [Planctomycetota bacterium]
MAAGLFAMVVMNFLNVVCRYLLPQTPFSFTEELTLFLFVWLTMFGISLGYKRSAHTGLSLVTDILPERLKRGCLAAATLCSGGLMVVVFWSGVLLVQNQLKYGNIMPGLKISAAWGGLAVPIGAAVIFFRILQVGVEKLREPAGKETTP